MQDRSCEVQGLESRHVNCPGVSRLMISLDVPELTRPHKGMRVA